MSKSRDIPETLQFGPECVSEDHAKATLFNKYFFSVFTSSSFEVPQMEGRSSPPALLASVICSEEEVHIPSSLNVSKALGIDSISSIFLKQCAVPLTPPLTALFNLSFYWFYSS